MPRKRARTEKRGLETPDDPDNFRVSQSKVKTWRRCRQAYHLKYVEKLKAKKKSRPLTFGTLIHKMIEVHAEGDDPMSVVNHIDFKSLNLFAAERAEYEEIVEDARRIMAEYFIHWESQPSPMRYERIGGKSAEYKFDIEILPNVIWNGKIDARGKRVGLRWLVEHKSFNRRPNDDDRWRNLQSSTYFRAMDIIGMKPVDGTCWDYIWSKPPRVPGLLKNGKMSKKSIETLPSTVEQAVQDYGLRVGDYSNFIKAVEKNRNDWFFRVYARVDEEVRDFIFDEFISTVKEMVDGHGKKSDMNIERHCSWCEFEPLCRARLQGLDYDFIKERQYETATKREESPADYVIDYEKAQSFG